MIETMFVYFFALFFIGLLFYKTGDFVKNEKSSRWYIAGQITLSLDIALGAAIFIVRVISLFM